MFFILKIYWGFVLPSRSTKSSSPFTRRQGHKHGRWEELGNQKTSIIQRNARKNNLHILLHFLSVILFRQRLVHLHKHTRGFFSHIFIYNPLLFTFTVCATTSHRKGVGLLMGRAEKRGSLRSRLIAENRWHPEMLTDTR